MFKPTYARALKRSRRGGTDDDALLAAAVDMSARQLALIGHLDTLHAYPPETVWSNARQRGTTWQQATNTIVDHGYPILAARLT